METTRRSIDIYSRLSKEAPGDVTLLKLKMQGHSLPNAFKRKKKKPWLFTSNNHIIVIIKYIFNKATATLKDITIHSQMIKALI